MDGVDKIFFGLLLVVGEIKNEDKESSFCFQNPLALLLDWYDCGAFIL